MAGKYELQVEPHLEAIKEWAKTSTDKEIAEALNISYASFKNYKKKHKALRGALIAGRTMEPNMDVLGAFHKRATGCEVKETIKERVDGKMVVIKEIIKEIPPDVEAGKFWLKNRMPEDFKDKHDLQHSMVKEEQSKLDDLVRQISGEEVE